MKQLTDDITVLPALGLKTAASFMELGITTVESLLMYFPFRYDDTSMRDVIDIQDQEKVVLKGIVVTAPVVNYYGKKNRLTFRMKVDETVIGVTFFNQGFLKSKICLDEPIAIYGKWNRKHQSLSGMRIMDMADDGALSPVYHVNKKVKQKTLVRFIKEAFDHYGQLITEILPMPLIQKYKLMPRAEAIYALHFPKDMAQYQRARQRMAYEEFFLFEMRMQGLRHRIKQETEGQCIAYDNAQLKAFIQTLPFELTEGQKRATNDVCRDLLSPHPMNRLLQGDVGSGKTIVAALGLFATATAGFQGAFMVPTEILATQHYKSLSQLFEGTPYTVALLTSSTTGAERQRILDDIASGDIHILVGTHALIQEHVQFHRLDFVVIDEQHRFGVAQRQALREKGKRVDVLAMTATPIPRTLAITAYGEMDVSMIKEMPKGRLPIQTHWIRRQQLEDALARMKPYLAKGQQMYVICPLIEASEAIDAKNAEALYEELQQYYEPEYHVGLLHGKMKNDDKNTLMDAFQRNECQILVSTTVIEVGVDVPNATMMLIMDADRFGLAQLHQLRGRVGRGQTQSYCVLVANPKSETGEKRMQIMTQTTDGFVLSQHDLEMRGPGEFFGHRQSGVPAFKVGDMIEDQPILEAATADAVTMWQTPWYNEPDYQALLAHIDKSETQHFD